MIRRTEYYGGGNHNDIRMSYKEYWSLINNMVDDRVDDQMMIKFKYLKATYLHANSAASILYISINI